MPVCERPLKTGTADRNNRTIDAMITIVDLKSKPCDCDVAGAFLMVVFEVGSPSEEY